jgi:hypothetical protein
MSQRLRRWRPCTGGWRWRRRGIVLPTRRLGGSGGGERHVLLAGDEDLRVEPHLTADEWVGMVTTFSDHQRMGPERLTALRQALRAAIERLGGAVYARGGTYVRLARRA